MLRPSRELCACGNTKSQVAAICLECRRKRVAAICRACGRKCEHKPSRPRAACSSSCADQLRAVGSRNTQCRKVALVCQRCGRTKRVSPAYASRRFCSSRCHYEHNRGPANAAWKGGVTSEHQRFFASVEWKRVCQRVWARDRRTCQRCGTVHNGRGPVHEVHHVAVWTTFPELRIDLGNLRLMCRGCHRFIHSRSNTAGEFLWRLHAGPVPRRARG